MPTTLQIATVGLLVPASYSFFGSAALLAVDAPHAPGLSSLQRLALFRAEHEAGQARSCSPSSSARSDARLSSESPCRPFSRCQSSVSVHHNLLELSQLLQRVLGVPRAKPLAPSPKFDRPGRSRRHDPLYCHAALARHSTLAGDQRGERREGGRRYVAALLLANQVLSFADSGSGLPTGPLLLAPPTPCRAIVRCVCCCESASRH
jgi:hypothetical protein